MFLNTWPEFFLCIKNGFTSYWRFVLSKNWIDRHEGSLKPHHANKYQKFPLITRNMWNFLPNWVKCESRLHVWLFRSIQIIFIRGCHKMLVSRQIFLVNFILKWSSGEQPVFSTTTWFSDLGKWFMSKPILMYQNVNHNLPYTTVFYMNSFRFILQWRKFSCFLNG